MDAPEAARRVTRRSSVEDWRRSDAGAPCAPTSSCSGSAVCRGLADQIVPANGRSRWSASSACWIDRVTCSIRAALAPAARRFDASERRRAFLELGGRSARGIGGADVHREPRGVASRSGRRHERRDRRFASSGARARLSRRAREQEAAGGVLGTYERRWPRRCRAAAAFVRGHGRRRAADHRHLSEAGRDR